MITHLDRTKTMSTTLDLRRRQARAGVERLVERAACLDDDERRLITAIFEDGRPASAFAREHRQDPRLVRRRVRSIATRVLNPRFDYVRNHAERWRPTRRRIATSLYIKGRSMRETAEHLGLSLYLVRLNRDAVEAMFEADDASRRRTTTAGSARDA